MNDNWERIFTSPSHYEVEVLKAVLEAENIPAFIMDKQDSFYQFGEIELYTTRQYVLRAVNIIEKRK